MLQANNIPTDVLTHMKNGEEFFWMNPKWLPAEDAEKTVKYSIEDVEDVEARWQRFASFIRVAFPQTQATGGIIESDLSEIETMEKWLEDNYEVQIPGKLYLKRDDQLPISGTIKARGAIYEVLKHAEDLALEFELLESTDVDYSIFNSEQFRDFFSKFNLTVGTTGNLGISVGTMGRALGFEVTVHMSKDAKEWKKEYLRARGVEVIEHETNFTEAVTRGREISEEDPMSYFVDDEHSEELFLGYTVGGYRMKKQLEEKGIKVDEDHPLFFYLPCGIGGSPSGITFGLKQAFGDNVHCFFAEPSKMPSMILGLTTQQFSDVAVDEIGQGGLTVADGLAVPRTSALVAETMNHYFSGGYTLTDDTFEALLKTLYEQEDIFLEPAAVAGLAGAIKLVSSEDGKEYLKAHNLEDKMENATHIAWATGGSMVPACDRHHFLKSAEGKTISK